MPNMGIGAKSKTSKPRHGVREAPARYDLATKATGGLADALFTTTQQRVLGALYGQPQRGFTVTELIASTGAGSGAVQRELAKLTASGLLTMRQVGNQKYYQPNLAAPIHDELLGIVQKTVGLAEPLRAALAPLAKKIIAAFVYGSIAKRSDTASSDIDLMIVSDKLSYAEVFAAVDRTANHLGRAVNPTVYTRAELAKRIKTGNAFVTRVLAQPKLWVIGGESELGA